MSAYLALAERIAALPAALPCKHGHVCCSDREGGQCIDEAFADYMRDDALSAPLGTYSEADLAQAARVKAERAQADEREARAAERKVQADRERDHFTLTPNDDPQRDLL